ncbi:MAG: LacI family DNA-binding transcriptional regulator [Actinomycetales bacterium]
MPGRRRRVTLRDLADDTGLSPAAISYALRGLHVPQETQARAREAADRLGYQVDPIARALALGRTDTVGVLCGSLDDIWQQSVAAALGRELLAVGRIALIVDAANDPGREEALAQRLVDQRVDAMIALPVDPKAAHWARIAKDTALVSIGDGLPGAATVAEVTFDNVQGVTDGLEQLAHAGHARVAVLTPSDRATPDRPAEVVVARVATRLGLTATLRTTPHDLDGASEAVYEVLSGPNPPTAFLCLADSIAFGVYDAANRLGLRVPADVSVIGYDDLPVSRLLSPPLSTYRWPVADLVEAVVARTVQAIDDGRSSRRKVLRPERVERGSVGPARG